jgi:MoxR-like ATPase
MEPSKKIDQILRILSAVRDTRPADGAALEASRKRATRALAGELDIDERTVADKCWRGLWREKDENFHIKDFDRLVGKWLFEGDTSLRLRLEDAAGRATRDADLAAIASFFVGGAAPVARKRLRRGAEIVSHVTRSLAAEGLQFDHEQVADFYLCMRAKPFVLFAGVSGTGKSILARRFAGACGFGCQVVPVRPDWSDPSELLGYHNLQGQFVPGRLVRVIVEALRTPDRPYFLVLDEMNLARVEHYLADVLSILETRRRSAEDDDIVTDALLELSPTQALLAEAGESDRIRQALQLGQGRLGLPSNLVLVGTVNMDESTHPFSKKVLDRAMTIEFRDADLAHVNALAAEPPDPLPVAAEELSANHLRLAEVWGAHAHRFERALDLLVRMNEPLSKASLQVGYRVRDEVCLYLHHNAEDRLLPDGDALDLALHHKLLPRIRGGDEVEGVLRDLATLAAREGLARCTAKLGEMQQRLQGAGGYTSFWS